MKRTFALFIVSFLLVLSSCTYISGKRVKGNGVTSTQLIEAGNFEGVRVRGGIDVIVSPGANYAVKIEADENLLEYIEVKNDDGVIDVGNRDGYNLIPKAGIKVYATAPYFSSIEVAGSGDIRSTGKITANDNLHISIKGSGDIKLDVDAPEVESQIAGSGSINLNGATKNFTAGISGSGDVHGFDLLSENTIVDIAGSGNAEVFASKQLNVEIKGAGDVAYKGAATVNQKILGSGSVRQVQ